MLCGAQATTLVVDNQTPGWLSSKINYGDQQTVENLTVTGYINGTDIGFIRELINNRTLHGVLDLSEANIVSGGNPYYYKNKIAQSGPRSTEDYTISEYMFAENASIRKLVLPKSTKSIYNENVFWKSSIDSLIVDCPDLEIFQGLKYTSYDMTNIRYIYFGEGIENIILGGYRSYKSVTSGEAILSLPSSLKEISCDGGITPYITIYSNISNPKDVEENAINTTLPGIFNDGVVYVPEGTASLYKNSFFKRLKIVEDIYPADLIISNKLIRLYVGDSHKVPYKIEPINSIHNELQWTSSDEGVVSVDNEGNIYARSLGSATVSAKTCNNIVSTIQVSVYNHVTKIELPASLRIDINSSIHLEPVLFPQNQTYSQITYSSSNNDIATVDADGAITGHQDGKCVITATATDGGYTASCEVTVVQPVEIITLSSKVSSVKVGEKVELSATVYPSNATNKQIKWSSSDSNIAKVNENGLVDGIKGGEVIITATSVENPEIKDECTVTVIQPATGISLNKTALELVEDDTEKLEATLAPEDATNKSVNWTSSDISVAMVSSDGTVYAIKPGQATIMVTSVDGGFVALCKVTVKAKTILAESLNITSLSSDLTIGETVQLTATVLPENATSKGVRWTSTNSEVATVNETGLVKAIKEGTAQIIASTTDGSNLSAICEITVKKNFVAISQISIIPASAQMKVGETLNLGTQIAPADASNKNISWSSTNSSVASVSSEGVVTANNSGNAIIIASTRDGSNLSATCTVTVEEVSGIEEIYNDKEANVKIFNLQGILIYEGAYSTADLAPGTYIIIYNGKPIKRVVR